MITISRSEQLNKARAAVANYRHKQVRAGISQQMPASTLRTTCAICGSVHGKPWSDTAKELCRHGCYWILARHIGWDGGRRRMKFFTAEAVDLMATYKTYDKLMAEGVKLDARIVSVVEPEVSISTV